MSGAIRAAAVGGAVGAVTGVVGMVAMVFAAAAVSSTRARRKTKAGAVVPKDHPSDASKFIVVPGGAS